MKDIRDLYLQRAEQLAEMTYDTDFYSLSKARQYEVYQLAEQDVNSDIVDEADFRRECHEDFGEDR